MNDVQSRSYLVDNESWWILLVGGIVNLVLGILITVWPKASTAVLVILVGIAILLIGIVAFIRSFTLIKREKNWWILLIQGIVGIVIAILLLAWPVGTTAIIAYFIAAFLVIIGILTIIFGIMAKSAFPIIGGVVALIIGIVLFFVSPANVFAVLMFIFGIYLIFKGIILIIQSIIKKRQASVVT